MTADRWQQVSGLYHAAVERLADTRAAFLREACGTDDALRREVESLLAHEGAAEHLMNTPPLDLAAQAVSESAANSSSLVGRRIGSYPIVAQLGIGGMGEVYRARDVRLERDVAIKILSAPFSMDPGRRARFEREARILAALNHPNIAAIYGATDVELSPDSDLGSVQALILELVEGRTLAERLADGPIPLRQALTIAAQIAEALDAAHEKGIVHRDLKPANIKIAPDGKVKVLDFGLAKAVRDDVDRSDPSQLAVSVAGSREGLIVGTAGYISPEQAHGQFVDKRTDIWAFGCVLYEMLTGRRGFPGATMSDTIAAILEREPDWTALPTTTPPSVRRLLARCLTKDPKRRLRDIGDVLIDLEKPIAPEGVAVPSTPISRRWVGITAVLLLTTLALVGRMYFARASVETNVFRSSILPPAALGGPAPDRLAISPDGRRLAMIAPDAGGRVVIWIRSLDGLTAQPLAGTEGAAWQFWSPNSRFLGFIADGKLKKIEASGGQAVYLADAWGYGGAWNRDNVILFRPPNQNLIYRVSADGGTPTAITALDDKAGDSELGSPFFLPDGKHFVYSAATRKGGRAAIYIASLDSTDRKRLIDGGGNAKFADGFLLFLQGTTLMAQPLDTKRLAFTGEPTPQVEEIATGGGVFGGGAYTVSETGLLVYQTGPGWVRSRLSWFDRTGNQASILEQGADGDLELSPDHTHAAGRISEINADIWIIDLTRDSATRFTDDPAHESMPVWSRDGRIAFSRSSRAGQSPGGDLFVKTANGASAEEALLQDGTEKFPASWSADGRFVLYGVASGSSRNVDLWALPTSGNAKPYPILQTKFNERIGKFSPDGRWVAFTSDETGRTEVYVMPFAEPRTKVPVSRAGGDLPRWRGDGNEIFYVAPGNKLMAVTVNGRGANFNVGVPQRLFDLNPGGVGYFYDVTSDGQRFLALTRQEQPRSVTPITLVMNWATRLKRIR
jgi:eukaryotic-like serine/threonine-protein kinase